METAAKISNSCPKLTLGGGQESIQRMPAPNLTKKIVSKNPITAKKPPETAIALRSIGFTAQGLLVRP